MKKLFAMLLSLTMVLTFIPVTAATAFAAEKHVHNYGTPLTAAQVAGRESEYIKVGNDEFFATNYVVAEPGCTVDGYGELHCVNCGEAYKATIECNKCDGKGKVDCPVYGCDGGKLKCTAGCDDGKLTCTSCNGSRSVICSNCNGNKEVNCSKCNGVSKVKCDNCGGDGKRGVLGKDGDLKCLSCSGTGMVDCRSCKNGKVDCNKCRNGSVTCSSCRGIGYYNCKTCKGRGTVDCQTCKRGTVTCEACQGKKVIKDVVLTGSIPSLGHNYQWTTELEPTYFAEGISIYQCIKCGNTDFQQYAVPVKELAKATDLKVSVKTKKQAKVTFKSVQDATSYEVAYKISGGKYKYKTITKTSLTLKKLKSGKKYTFKVRAIITEGEQSAAGAWTSTKTVKVK